MKNLKIELHLLQSFPPSCLNRDDTNTPKTCEFGGVSRARVSSQCWKNSIRKHFQKYSEKSKGMRSLGIKMELIRNLSEANVGDMESLDQPVTAFVTQMVAKMKIENKQPTNSTETLFFWSEAEFRELVHILSDPEYLAELRKDKPNIRKSEIDQRLEKAQLSADIALFGRMVASNYDLNVEAACQVAHAISTHEVRLETDFFAAIDELNSAPGAAMLGTVMYDSACYYRYTLLDVAQLTSNLRGTPDEAFDSVKVYLQAFMEAVPNAKQNSFAHGVLPFFAFAVVREAGTPSSLVNAFAKPVSPRRGGDLLSESALALTKHAARLNEVYDLYDGAKAFYFSALDAETDLAALPGENVVKSAALVERTLEAARNFAEAQ
ncbi:MAG: type I-E CRISPR-associated protein Cas7/Cse4/CasC [Armatimonadetes bacterium]|nr:type I-E CRISPR-associated protein Cas7/Cse4/CasC [Armatimonadota bacterium]